MKYLLTMLVAAAMAVAGHAMGALFVWLILTRLIHCIEETDGRLWHYFGQRSGRDWLLDMGDEPGFFRIVFPAFALQAVAAWLAFLHGDSVSAVPLAVVIGASLADGLFSHAILSAQDGKPNPGFASGLLYLVDGLLMTAVFRETLAADAAPALLAGCSAALFFLIVFAVVQKKESY